MATYKVLRGTHTQVEKASDGPGKRVKEVTRINNGIKEVVGYRKTYAALVPRRKGDAVIVVPQEGFAVEDQFFQTDIDMVQRFGPDKFEKVNVPIQDAVKQSSGDDLEDMTVKELKQFAAEEEVDIGVATKKEEIVQIIRSTMTAVGG